MTALVAPIHVPALLGERYCAPRTATSGQDPIGTAGTISRLLAMEAPTPWLDSYYDSDPGGTTWQRIMATRIGFFERQREAGIDIYASGYPALYGFAPDAEWSSLSIRRVLLFTPPADGLGEFTTREYHFPFDSERLVAFTNAFLESPDDFSAFEDLRIEHGGYREFFVCTHGQVDICCARFGVPIYRQARAAFPTVRAWRMTHFGGHRYAPTAWEFPAAYKGAFLEDDSLEQIISRSVAPVDLHRHLRGWSGIPLRAQLLDRVGLERFGWSWLAFKRRAEATDIESIPGATRVRLEWESPSGERGVFAGLVRVGREFEEPGCGPKIGQRPFDAAEYTLEDFTESSGTPNTQR